MTAYTRTKNGPPISGRYNVNDVVTDRAGVKWRCVVGGMAGLPGTPAKAQFAIDPSGTKAQATPAAKTTTTTLTAAEILGGLITANQGAAGAATYTLPLGTDIEAAAPYMQVDDSFDFSIVNISTNATEDVTVAGNTGTTAVGNMTVASNAAVGDQATGLFRVRKTAANTYSCYRVAS